MSEQDKWDLSLQIEGLSLRVRGLRLSATPPRSQEPSSPTASTSSFVLVPPSPDTEPSRTRVHPTRALDLDLAVGPNPLQASATAAASASPALTKAASPARSLPSSSAAPSVPEYPLQCVPYASGFLGSADCCCLP